MPTIESNLSWRLFNNIEKDLSWRLFNNIEKDLSWRLFNNTAIDILWSFVSWSLLDIIETNCQLLDANSYLTVLEADAILIRSLDYALWEALSPDDKVRYLIKATEDIDVKDYLYGPFYNPQYLKFPLSINNLESGLAQAKKACAEQVIFLCKHANNISENEAANLSSITNFNISGYSKRYAGSSLNKFKHFAPSAYKLLSPYLNFEFKTRRG